MTNSGWFRRWTPVFLHHKFAIVHNAEVSILARCDSILLFRNRSPLLCFSLLLVRKPCPCSPGSSRKGPPMESTIHNASTVLLRNFWSRSQRRMLVEGNEWPGASSINLGQKLTCFTRRSTSSLPFLEETMGALGVHVGTTLYSANCTISALRIETPDRQAITFKQQPEARSIKTSAGFQASTRCARLQW